MRIKAFFKKLGIILGVLLLIILILAGINTLINGNRGSNMRTNSVPYNASVKKIAIDQDIPVKFQKGKHPKVSYHVNKNQIPKVKSTNRVLRITNSSRHGFDFSFNFSFLSKVIRFGSYSHNEYITITLPKLHDHISTLDARQDADDINLSNLNLKNIYLSADAGDIHLSHLKAKDLKISSDSGDVYLSRSRARTLHVSADAGDIHILKLKARKLRVYTDAGDIHLSNVRAHSLIHHTDAGDVDIHH